MNDEPRSLFDELNAYLAQCEVYDFITRDSGLQHEACETLTDLLTRLADLKRSAIANQDEDLANTLLGFECAAHFLRSSIRMWLFLKAEKPEEAWRELVNAQMAVADAVRAHKGFERLARYADRLHVMEEMLFPPQVFTSLGMIVRARKCSVCDAEYGECSHVVGKPYMGQLCHTIVTEIEKLDHLSIVSNPANKLTRITHFSAPGGRRNRMTWKVEPDPPSREEPETNASE